MAEFVKYDDLFDFDGDLFEDPFNDGKDLTIKFKGKNASSVSTSYLIL